MTANQKRIEAETHETARRLSVVLGSIGLLLVELGVPLPVVLTVLAISIAPLLLQRSKTG